MIRVSGQSKSRPVKAAGAESCGQRRNQKLHAAVAKSTFGSENEQNTSAPKRFLKLWYVMMSKNCTPLWRKAHVEVNMYKTRQVRSTFWSYDAENWRRCGKKHICKSKCTKHIMFGALFEVLTWKNGTPLWREAHLQVNMLKNSGAGTTFEDPMWKNCTQLWRDVPFQVKLYKTHQQRTVFWSSDVEKLHAAVARSTCVSQNVQNTCVLAHFLKFRCRKISQLASSSVNQSVRSSISQVVR